MYNIARYSSRVFIYKPDLISDTGHKSLVYGSSAELGRDVVINGTEVPHTTMTAQEKMVMIQLKSWLIPI